MKKEHLASYGLYCRFGKNRIGTAYVYSLKDCSKFIGERGFRFRNKDCEREWLDYEKGIER